MIPAEGAHGRPLLLITEEEGRATREETIEDQAMPADTAATKMVIPVLSWDINKVGGILFSVFLTSNDDKSSTNETKAKPGFAQRYIREIHEIYAVSEDVKKQCITTV